MFCPKCSQQRLAEDLRFCSRCGFPLTGVAFLLEHDGLLPQSATPTPGRRGRMVKESGVLTFASWGVALLTTLAWDWGVPIESVARVGSIIFFLLGLIGLLRFVYAFLFVRDGSTTTPEPAFPVSARRAALPSPQETPLTDYPQRPNTREMIPRVSVTENTTRLLDEE